ncbi:NAD(P)-dependent dehydrogenase (short-subunit alcohol dehydrogenase family) [Litorivivens lipolytica]|uniref:NAD(P)-dependent dehydrogenase (Short-subunit alcohol dehydrogenase family) n=1 Tax=Litorivivens lipolytica TaxID=1524264 RepID=A0A7W4W1Y8_9GAMM|nr:SDR family NAD(P)-dependent oxidoreductase [Litorivivens lipolytica]MBB3045909.1 NAD(P)-dependent dehydrogenase (short-subunit alcohol dehydrogenase family) [Litorivivens lipolytica]
MKIVIVGGSGGIGLAIVKQALQYYPEAYIIATWRTRQPDFTHQRLRWHPLDAANEKAVAEMAEQLGSVTILINAIGLLHTPDHRPEKTIREFDPVFFQENMAANTLPSILLAKYFMKSLRSDNPSWFISLSARVGSISDNHLGGWLSYRASKAALNMAVKTIAIEWKVKLPNCCVLLFHPGTTDSALSQPFHRNLPEGQLHSPNYTAETLMETIKESRPEDSGRFVSFDGNDVDW